ncbi:MAG: ATP-binding protein [Rhodocyclaceae bacterium]|nr:ATP-binding protein [Rhodocyclaceae bacterium]
MNWRPRSLFGRNALFIVALIVLGQLGGAVLLRQMVVKPRLDQAADGVARTVAAIRAGLVTVPAAQRQAFVEAFNARARAADGGREAPAPALLRPLLTPLERGFVRRVSARLADQGVEVIWRRDPSGRLALRLPMEGSDAWVVLPGLLPEREFTGAWLAVSTVSVVLAIAGALWLQTRLDRPLARVVGAARALAGGQVPAPLPEDGPTEIATVSRSFNQLVASLQQAERDRALMLAGLSHDLRTPLTKLRLGVEILHGRSEPELMASMTRSIEELDAIVGQFLDFARGEEAEALVPVDLDALARAVHAAAADHGRTLRVEASAGGPPVPARPKALRRVLDNLVENAFRHGKPPVVLRTGREAPWAWIEVEDRGPGIDPAQADLLKQPFRRAGDARSGAAGAGLGLAIAERIARGHGGRFELLPAVQGGLRARVSLPLDPGDLLSRR